MKAYKVNVNGNVYEITLEVINKEDIKTTAPAAPAAPAQAAPAAPAQAGGTTVSAPMPGTILKVNVANGQAVKKGDVLMVLEAMKMENEIMAPCDGTIASVNVQASASVETGAVLCSIA
jgi:biotin carboxyl carrier protein